MHKILRTIIVILLSVTPISAVHGTLLNPSSSLHASLTEEEISWLKLHPVISVGINHGWAPVEFLSENGEFRGISIDFLKRLEAELGIRFSMVRKTDDLTDVHTDMLAAVPNPRLLLGTNYEALQTPYLEMPYAIFTRDDNLSIEDINDLYGKTVSVFKNGPIVKQLSDEHPLIKLYKTDIAEEALGALKSGKVDAYVGNLVVVSYVARSGGFGSIHIAGETPYKANIYMAVKKDYPILSSILQKGLEHIGNKEKDRISSNWMATTQDYRVFYPWIITIMGISILIISVFAYSNRRMNREIQLRKAVEADLIQEKIRVETASLAKSQFLANMSHEIRTPMNGILGVSEMLMDPNIQEKERKDFSETIHKSANSLLSILNDILDISKIEAGMLDIMPDKFIPQDIVNDVFSLFNCAARDKGLAFSLQVEGPSEHVYIGDPVRIRQVLCNLVSNAIKFSEYGGKVRLFAYILSDVENNNKIWLNFEVSDTGIGIDLIDQEKLFKPFSQADSSITRRYGGTGLGLSISKELCELMGGSITVDSSVGIGSTFKIQIPVTESVDIYQPINREKPTLLGKVNKDSYRILVAEDNEVNSKVIASFLVKLGYQFKIVSNGQEAISALAENQFDLVLMDYHMPVMDGVAATKEIRLREQNTGIVRIPIIAVTAAAFPEEKQACAEAGMDDLLAKPVTLATLRTVLEKWLLDFSHDGLFVDEKRSHQINDNSITTANNCIAIAPIDYGRLLAYLDNNVDAVKELLKTAHENLSKEYENLKKAHTDGDWKLIYRINHKIKGMTSVIYANAIVSSSTRLESLLKQESVGFNQAEIEIATLGMAIQTFLSYDMANITGNSDGSS
jgi:signal transduction histidine kinase/CheY-like chemotaxis protein/HPt (histidine-containing phosphotransfer) domain-containing protein